MKIRLALFAALIALLIPAQVNAAVTVDQAISKEYIKNNGYSEITSEAVTVAKNRAEGKEYYTPQEQRYNNSNKFCKFFRNFYNYLDPAADDYSYFHHNIKGAPAYSDL